MTRFRKYSKIGLLALLALTASFYGTSAGSVPTVDFREGKQGPELRVSVPTAEVAEASGSDGVSSKATRGKATFPTNAQPAAAESDQIIIKYQERTGQAERASIRRQEKIEKLRDLGLIRAEVAKVSGRSVADAVRSLNRRPDVAYAEPDYTRRPSGYSDEADFGQLWGLHNTGQTVQGYPGVSDVDTNALQSSVVTLGSPTMVVAVIDDGVDFSHPDLSARRWNNPGESGTDSSGRNKASNRHDDDGNGYVDDINGWDFYNNDNTVHDVGEDSHGTHVAGTIAASLDGKGVVGVAPSVKVMALKFLGPTGGSTSDAILAIQYASNKGVRISNNSWGGPGYSKALKDAIDQSGQLFVAAAGNNAKNQDTSTDPDYPAAYSSTNLLAIAAVHNEGGLSSFSNYGAKTVDISAPGEDILSSVPTEYNSSRYANLSGTSMAAPHVTGAAALMASVNPSLAPLDLKKILMDTGKALPKTTGYTVTGDIVDAYAATTRADTVKPVVRTLAQSFTVGTQVNTGTSPATVSIRLNWSATDTGSSISRYELQQSSDSGTTYSAVSLPTATSTARVVSQKADSTTGYRFRVRARDQVGNWSDWRYTTPAFKIYPYQEASSGVTYPSGSWTRGTSSSWYGGNVRYGSSSTARSKFTFTGRNVAWVAPKGADRGKAELWLDGSRVASVDLYSSTLLPRRIVFTRGALNPSVTHTLEVRVLGTSGRPRVDVDSFVVLR